MTDPDASALFSRRKMLFYLGASGLALTACSTDNTAGGGSSSSAATTSSAAPTSASSSAAASSSAVGSSSSAATSASSSASSSAAGTGKWGMNEAQAAAWNEIEAAANKEGTLVYYSVGGIPADKVEMFQAAFAKDYPGIEIQYLAPGNNAAVISKVITEQQSGTVVGDVAETSMGNVVNVGADLLQDYAAPAGSDPTAKMAFNPIGMYEGKPKFTGMNTQNYGIWYNTEDVAAADAPKTYQDLTDPKWKDLIVWRQPWNTGGGNHTYRFIKAMYGAEWVQKMQAQNITFVEDQDAALLQVARGEFSIGMGLTGRQGPALIDQGLPIAISWPTDLNVRVTNGLIIPNKAPHTNAAKVLANWMISVPGQEMWRTLGQYPINLNVPPLYDWMEGYTVAKVKEENLANGAALEKLLAEAKADFQK